MTVNHYAPALVFLCILSLMCLSTRNVYRLIDYAAFVEFMFILVAIAGFPYLRYTRPDLPRPIKITLGIAIIFLLICTFLEVSSFPLNPLNSTLLFRLGLLIAARVLALYQVEGQALLAVHVPQHPGLHLAEDEDEG